MRVLLFSKGERFPNAPPKRAPMQKDNEKKTMSGYFYGIPLRKLHGGIAWEGAGQCRGDSQSVFVDVFNTCLPDGFFKYGKRRIVFDYERRRTTRTR